MLKSSSPEKTLTHILQHDPESVLAFIQNKILQITKLNQIWQAEISLDLAAHSRVANFREGLLIIECASAAWATRFRYLLTELSEKLTKYPELRDLTHIQWNIQPHFHTHSPKPRRTTAPALSSTSAQLLKNAAHHIKLKSLQEALLRIAQHGH